LENIYDLNYHWGSKHLGAARLRDKEAAVREMQRLRRDGGRSLVEVSSLGLRRDPIGLREIAERSGVHIVMGSGTYTEEFLSPEIRDRSVDQIVTDIVGDVRKGVGNSSVRAGIIGEIGCSVPWTPAEQRAMRAAAIAQQETGAAITVHPGRSSQSPLPFRIPPPYCT
jgi:phosphotriesterase-related protein